MTRFATPLRAAAAALALLALAGCSGVPIDKRTQGQVLGGVTGADSVCQARANAAGLSGTFKAWISGGSYSSSPASRFTRSTVLPYVRIDGAVVANDWNDLTDGTIQNPINIDEFGNLQYSFAESVAAMMPFYAMRAIGGMFFLTGAVLMTHNMFMTIRQGKREAAALEAKLAAKMAHA